MNSNFNEELTIYLNAQDLNAMLRVIEIFDDVIRLQRKHPYASETFANIPYTIEDIASTKELLDYIVDEEDLVFKVKENA